MSVCIQYENNTNMLMIRLCYTIVLYITIHGHTFVWIELIACIQYENNMNILMRGLSCSGVIYVSPQIGNGPVLELGPIFRPLLELGH